MYHKFIPWLKTRKLNLVQIQTISSCNAKCIVCPHKDSPFAKERIYMSDKLYSKILDDIADYDRDFTGKFAPYLMNEPFMDKNILRRIEEMYDKLYNPYLEISSNMELLNKQKIDKLYSIFEKHDFYGKFTISHHGYDKESVERIMGINYDKAKENIIYLLQKFDGTKLKITIQDISYSFDMKYELNRRRKVINYLEKLLDESKIFHKENIIRDPKIFHNRAANVKLDGWNYNTIVRKIDINHPFDCIRIHGCLHVLSTGETTVCCMDYFKEEIITNLNNISVREHFNSENWKDIVDRVTGRKESSDNFICKRCMSPGG